MTDLPPAPEDHHTMNAPETVPPAAQVFNLIALPHLHPSPTNPRRSFPQDKLDEMAESIRHHGVLQPILARPWPDGQALRPGSGIEWTYDGSPQYEIVAGERRYRAAGLAGLEAIPAHVRHLTDIEVLEIQIIENLQREEVHPLEEGEGYRLLMQRTGYSADDLAAKVGKSKAYIYARLKLCAIQGQARTAFEAGTLSASIALFIARIPVLALQEKAAKEVTEGYSGPMSARQAAEHIQRQYMLRLADAPFPRGDAKLVDGAPSCHKCPSRTGNQPELFADVKSADVCTDPACFDRKREAHKARQATQAKEMGKKVIIGKEAQKIAPQGFSEYGSKLNGGWEYLDRKVWEAPAKKNNEHPTWRELLGDDFQAPAIIEDSRGGRMREVAQSKDLWAAAQARDIELRLGNRAAGEADRDREKKAKAETAWRTMLLDRILSSNEGADLGPDDLRDVAAALYHRLGSDTEKRLCTLLRGTGGREDAQALRECIPTLAPDAINRLLLAMALIGQAHVATWQTNEPPEALLATAERWGVDSRAVKQQAQEIKKAKPARAGQVRYRHPDGEQTWTGKGKPPRWVQECLAVGHTLHDLEVAG